MSGNVYDIEIDCTDTGDARVIALELVGANKRVLEFGCATGRVTEQLVQRGCSVTGVEIDAEAAEKARAFADDVVVLDLDTALDDLEEKLGGERWDVALFGDVLEHLRDPLSVLRAARRLLEPQGVLVCSVPNVAHGDVRLALLAGSFPYGPSGLLDSTHLRFFTLDTLRQLLTDAGFLVTDLRRTNAPIFCSELDLDPDAFPLETVRAVIDDPESETYQFVVKAVVDDGDAERRLLSQRCIELQGQLNEAIIERRRAVDEAEATHTRLAAANAEIAALEDAAVQLELLRQTKLVRYTHGLRSAYGRLRRRPST